MSYYARRLSATGRPIKITVADAVKWGCGHTAHCEGVGCYHSAEIDLIMIAGPAVRLDLIEDRLKCTKCGHQGAFIIGHPNLGMDDHLEPQTVCNFEKHRSAAAETRRWFKVQPEFDFLGNLGPVDKFPRRTGPVVRLRPDGRRELVKMEWGHPYYKTERLNDGSTRLALKANGEPYAPTPTTNIRHPHYPMFKSWLAPQYRCLVPSNLFAEPNPRAGKPGQPKNIWFGLKEPKEGLYAFAGIWRPWDGDWDKGRGSATSEVYAFLTTDPNELVAPHHPKAMPVILDPDDYETWLTADWAEAKRLQKPFPAEKMAVYDAVD